jgi:hypothetical protein
MYNLNMFMKIPLTNLNLQSILFPTLITMKEKLGIEKMIKCPIKFNNFFK